jgi:glycosyltransferase involved in cell wall biosynthesis
MRIALVVAGGVDRSGRERVTPALLWLVERLARRHDVHVFVLHYYQEPCSYRLLGADVHDIGRVDGLPGIRRRLRRRRLDAAIAEHAPFDVLHAYQGMPAAVAMPIAKRRGLPVVATLDSGELTSVPDIGYGMQRRWLGKRDVSAIVRSAARVTVSTEFMARQMSGIATRAPAIVPLGIDMAAFRQATRADGPPWRLLRVGSVNRVKDTPTLLRALAILIQRGLDVHLDIVGEDTMRGRMPQLAIEMQLGARVTFHGFQGTDRLAGFYERAHLHVVSSRHEAAGVVVLEAAAAGVATVGTNVGYVADWHPERALAVPVHDPDGLATGIADLIGDPVRRARMAAAARSWTLVHDADWTADQFERIYKEAAGAL